MPAMCLQDRDLVAGGCPQPRLLARRPAGHGCTHCLSR